MLQLIPVPKKVSTTAKKIFLRDFENIFLPENISSSLLTLLVTFADEWEKITSQRLRFVRSKVEGKSVKLLLTKADKERLSYKITSSNEEIILSSSTEKGLFYAIQTMRQLLRTEGIFMPELSIEDFPDYAARGFYHDCTRGKIPTLETLFALADKLAYYKIGEMQLYMEHTFAFARHSDIWSGADPITAEEIIRLDTYCKERHIELVPSLSTFGHFYMGLRSRRNSHLNELDVEGFLLPFSFHDRMAHYTLNASDPGSLKLIDDMLSEFLMLFSSSKVNICCDETYDLGKGKNAAKVKKLGSTERLYVDYLKKLISLVKKYGKRVMFWGDIIAHAPELIRELPSDTIPLEWDYGPAAKAHDTSVMQKSGLDFYICPGVSGWNTFLNRIGISSSNICNYAEKGLKYGAKGLLNTDWGDYGHVNMLGCSFFGLALGAGCAWNTKATAGDIAAFDKAFSLIELGDRSGTLIKEWRNADAALLFDYGGLQRVFDPALIHAQDERLESYRKNVPEGKLKKGIAAMEKARANFIAAMPYAKPLDEYTLEELLFGLDGNILVHKILGAILRYKGYDRRSIADEVRLFEVRFSKLWHRRNKPSEYYRNKDVLMKITEALDAPL